LSNHIDGWKQIASTWLLCLKRGNSADVHYGSIAVPARLHSNPLGRKHLVRGVWREEVAGRRCWQLGTMFRKSPEQPRA